MGNGRVVFRLHKRVTDIRIANKISGRSDLVFRFLFILYYDLGSLGDRRELRLFEV
jgi:hypothetical protein